MTDDQQHDELLDEKEPPKRREDLIPELLLMDNGEEVEGFPMSDAAVYLGIKRAGLNLLLKRLEKDGRPVRQYAKAYGGISRYLLKRDLDELRRIKPVE